jgi:FMN reductase
VFQASYSGLFKTFVDVLDDGALRGTPVLMAATAGTARHSLVLEHAMRPMFSYLTALTVPTAVFAASEDWGAGGTVDTGLSGRIDVAAAELADLLTGRPARADRVDEFADPVPFEQLLGH